MLVTEAAPKVRPWKAPLKATMPESVYTRYPRYVRDNPKGTLYITHSERA